MFVVKICMMTVPLKKGRKIIPLQGNFFRTSHARQLIQETFGELSFFDHRLHNRDFPREERKNSSFCPLSAKRIYFLTSWGKEFLKRRRF